jgi:hypothetical protein
MPDAAEATNAIPADQPIRADRPALQYDLIEYFSVASHVGKSMFATYTAALLRKVVGIDVVIVRIESKAARSKEADICINSEDFAASARLPGGEVALLRPLFDLLESLAQKQIRPVIIVDWGGGLAEHRAKIWASTRLDARLADFNMRGLSSIC